MEGRGERRSLALEAAPGARRSRPALVPARAGMVTPAQGLVAVVASVSSTAMATVVEAIPATLLQLAAAAEALAVLEVAVVRRLAAAAAALGLLIRPVQY